MDDPRTPASQPGRGDTDRGDRLLLLGEAPEDGATEPSTFLLPTGTVTFLLTDVEGSTASWERAPEAMAKAIDRHYQILGDVIGRHRGVRPVEQGEGDSVVAAFSRGTDAAAAALHAQQLLAAETWPDGASLSVRMALHTGDAQLRDAFNYFGPVIIRCARLRALAAGGQVLATGAAHEVIADGLPGGASWTDLGMHRLKDLSRPEWVFQLTHHDLPAEFPPLAGLDATPNNLPAQVSTFIGREHELSQVADFLDSHRLVTLTGAGGCGKTRLALQAAADRIERHPDGVRYVELAALSDDQAVERQIAGALGVEESTDHALIDLVAERIGSKQVLLVIDNCEHLLDGVALTARDLLRRCASLSVLATSRQPLDVDGEVSWRVPSMTLPADDKIAAVEALAGCDSVRLFVDRATRSRPDFVLDAGSAPVVASICRRLDGIPLALELAAARVRSLGLDDIANGLDDRFRLLSGGSRTLLPRQQTLAASVDWSHDLLDPSEQIAFRRLSVFAGPFTLDGARAVAEGSDLVDVASLLADLVDRSLAQLEDDREGQARYRYLETVKAYARGRLAETAEGDGLRDRHLAFHVDMAEQAEPALRDHEDHSWLVEVDRSLDDIRAALRWAATSFSHDKLLRLCAALGPYWHARGHSAEAQSWYETALAEPDPDGVPERALLRSRALWGSAYVALYANDLELSGTRATESIEVAQTCGDDRTIGRATDTLATLLQFVDPLAADVEFERAREIATRLDDRWCWTDVTQKLAFTAFYRDRWDEAVALGAQARMSAEQLENPFFVAWADVIDGTAALRAGHIEESRAWLTSGLGLATDVGEPMTIGVSGGLLALLEVLGGDVGAAGGAVDATAAAIGDVGPDNLGALMVGLAVGSVSLAAGDYDDATAAMSPLLDLLLSMELVQPTVSYLPYFGLAELALDDLEGVERVSGHLARLGELIDSDYARGMTDLLRALAERSRQRPDLAEAPARRAITSLSAVAEGPDLATALEVLAGTLGDLGNHAEGVRVLSALAARRSERGWKGRLAPLLTEWVERDLAACRTALGDEFDESWSEGSTMTLSAVVEHVSRARGTRKRPPSGWASLTPTEREVVEAVAAGASNPEIAAQLVMSRATVKTHVSHVLTKLGLRSRAEIAAEAARRGS